MIKPVRDDLDAKTAKGLNAQVSGGSLMQVM
jgi:hypothetical protein